MAKPRRPKQLTQAGGIYEGSAGDYAAQQNPQPYVNFLASQGGSRGVPGSGFESFMAEPAFANIYTGYTNALGANERLKFADYMSRFGGDLSGQLGRAFNQYEAEMEPQTRFNSYLLSNDMLGGSGNSYNDYLRGNYFTDVRGQFELDQMSDPTLGWDEYLNQQRSPNDPLFTGDLDGDGLVDDTSDLNEDEGGGKKKKKGGKR
jgi:hypothetical protein